MPATESMTDLEREELLSAYLDNELSAEERARVEGWLAESAELRQLHDELLALRAGMQALPRHKLDHDLAGRVLGMSMPAQTKPQDASERTIIPGSMQWWQRGSNVRRLLWPALAAAAALLILVYDANQRPDEQQVALAPPPESSDLESRPSDEPTDAKIGAAGELSTDSFARDDAAAAPGNAKAMRAEDRYAASPAEAPSPETASPEAASPEIMSPADRQRSAGRMLNQSAVPPAGDVAMRGRGKLLPEAAEANRRSMSAGGLYSQQAAGAKSDAPQTIVCPVSTSYLQSRDFEKLLDKNRIRWERIPVQATEKSAIEIQQNGPSASFQDEVKNGSVNRLQSVDSDAVQSWYFLHTTNAEVNEILSQVPQAAKLTEGNQALPRFTAPQRKLDDEAEPGVQVLLVAPQAVESGGNTGDQKR